MLRAGATAEGDKGCTWCQTDLHLLSPVVQAAAYVRLLHRARRRLNSYSLHACNFQSARPALRRATGVQAHLSHLFADLCHEECSGMMNVKPVPAERPAMDIVGA